METLGEADSSMRPGFVGPAGGTSIRFSDRTVTSLVRQAAEQWPDDAFVTIGQERLTFSDALTRSARVANALRGLGCEQGDVVALFMPTSPVLIDCYLGASHVGAITFPVNTSYRGYLLRYGLNDSGCKIVFAHIDLLERVLEVMDQLPALELIVVLGGSESDIRSPSGSRVQLKLYDSMLAESADGGAHHFAAVDPYQVNSIIYTSGTTGPSKGVLMSNAHATNKASSIMNICQMSRSDRIYAPVPLFHTFGLHRGVLTSLLGGIELVMRERFSARSFWSDVQQAESTIAFTTASMVQILKSAEPGAADSENGVRCMFSAPYDPVFEERFGLRLLQTFSLTEANNALYSPYHDQPRIGACGKPSPDWQVKLVNDDGEEVAAGASGEIWLRPLQPGQVMLGYHNQEAANRDAFRDLWLHTGDLGRRDDDGYYYFIDRKKDALRRRGENISSWEVERMVSGHPAIAESAALAYPSPVGEDDVWVVVTLKPGYASSRELLDDIAAYCDREMPDFMSQRYIEFRDELPKTPTEKVLKAELRKAGLGSFYLDRGDRRRTVSSTRTDHAR